MIVPLIGLIFTIIVIPCDSYNYYYQYSYPGQNSGANCVPKSYGLTTIAQVQEAINKAADGAVIRLDSIEYTGDLTITGHHGNGVTLLGESQCQNSTVIVGKITITNADNWSVSSIVLRDTPQAVDVSDSRNIRLANLVVNDISGTAISVKNTQTIGVNNLVIKNVFGNGVDISGSLGVGVNNLVVNNINGIGLNFNDCPHLQLRNNVVRNMGGEAIRVTGNSDNGVISSTVINGNSPAGEGWMYIAGNNWRISSTVATGAPKDGIVVLGCNNVFNANVFTNQGSGYSIKVLNTSNGCNQRIDISNINSGQRRELSNISPPSRGFTGISFPPGFPFNYRG